MLLSEERRRQLLLTHGVYLAEACDQCGVLIGPIRWTVHGESGVWCSRKCRDGVDEQPGVCHGCGIALAGKRKGAIYCGRTCRMPKVRRTVQNSPNIVNTSVVNKGLTDAVPSCDGEVFMPAHNAGAHAS